MALCYKWCSKHRGHNQKPLLLLKVQFLVTPFFLLHMYRNNIHFIYQILNVGRITGANWRKLSAIR